MDQVIIIFRYVFALALVFGLLFISAKLSNKGLAKYNENKYVKVIDRIQLTKDSAICIIKIGEKGLVVITSTGHTEKLEELTKEEIEKIEKEKSRGYEELSSSINKYIDRYKTKIHKIKSKEEKNEKICKEQKL